MIPVIEAKSLALTGIRHGFFTREGGVSTGLYESLNCGIGSRDARDAVRENRDLVAAALGAAPDRLAAPYQVHGNDAVAVDEVWAPGMGPKADAVVTNKPGVALAVGTADCGPILLADPKARVIGAAHAGWRGTLAGVGESAITAMEKLGARRERIVAVLGPTISQSNYEVGEDVRNRFIADNPHAARLFKPSGQPDHFLFDLPAAIVARLSAAGVNASNVDLCTYGEPKRFFSYRRSVHCRETDYGRMLSAILMTE